MFAELVFSGQHDAEFSLVEFVGVNACQVMFDAALASFANEGRARHPAKDHLIKALLTMPLDGQQLRELKQAQFILKLVDACVAGTVGRALTAEQFLAYLRTLKPEQLHAKSYTYAVSRLSQSMVGNNLLQFLIDHFYLTYCLQDPAQPQQSIEPLAIF